MALRLTLALFATVISGCSGPVDDDDDDTKQAHRPNYTATIQWTSSSSTNSGGLDLNASGSLQLLAEPAPGNDGAWTITGTGTLTVSQANADCECEASGSFSANGTLLQTAEDTVAFLVQPTDLVQGSCTSRKPPFDCGGYSWNTTVGVGLGATPCGESGTQSSNTPWVPGAPLPVSESYSCTSTEDAYSFTYEGSVSGTFSPQ